MPQDVQVVPVLDALRVLLSNSDAFNIFCGIVPTDSVAADLRIFDYTCPDFGPTAVLWPSSMAKENVSTSSIFGDIQTLVWFSRQSVGAVKDEIEAIQARDFLLAVDAVLQELADVTVGNLDQLNIIGWELQGPPLMADPAENSEVTKLWFKSSYILTMRC